MTKKHIITGVKSTGSSMHLGNLMGAILPFGRHATGNDAAIFIADLHALTSVKDGELLRAQTLEVAIEYLAIYGEDTPITIFRQSDIHLIERLMWILANVTPYSLMLRAHSFKDAVQKFHLSQVAQDEAWGEEGQNADEAPAINMGTFNYPILMAADILGYSIDAVPVGRDQLQHLEMTRDIARYFNKTYQAQVFQEPEAIIDELVATLPGLDGRKMSKSYQNFIGIFDDEKLLKKRVMSIVTDSKGVDDIKDTTTCTIFALLKIFGTQEQIETVRVKYATENSGFGYGHAKQILLEALIVYLRPYRERREKLLLDIPFVERRLAAGAKIMNARLEAKMQEVCRVVGIH